MKRRNEEGERRRKEQIKLDLLLVPRTLPQILESMYSGGVAKVVKHLPGDDPFHHPIVVLWAFIGAAMTAPTNLHHADKVVVQIQMLQE